MKLIIVALFLAYVSADVSHLKPAGDEADATITKQDLDVGLEGQYQWLFETSNGISASEQGTLKNVPGAEAPAQVAQGQARWTAPNGEVLEFSYIADENGYQPQGALLPTSPPIPEAIIRSIEFIRANPPKEGQA